MKMNKFQILFGRSMGAWLVVGSSSVAWAQVCNIADPASDAGLVETGFNNGVDADLDGIADPDPNGGWNVTPNAFSELGAQAVGSAFRFTGEVGTFVPLNGTSSSSRDLDWVRFSVAESCYLEVTLSMGRTVDGAAVGFAGGEQSYLSVYSGSDQAAATTLVAGSFDSDGCPQVPLVRLPNGIERFRIPAPAGDVVLVISTAFNPTTAPNKYDGPVLYAIDVSVSPLDNASCGTATGECTQASTEPGCSDALCCETVCQFNPECCGVAWDANCVQVGVAECGNFVFACVDPVAENDCFTTPAQVDLSGGSITFGFDNTDANTDGPNNVNSLCSSNTARDVWYLAGPAPTDGDLRVTMCGLGNLGDSVVSIYGLGTSADIGDPSDLPSKYISCRDDSCDEDGDGTTDSGGPSAITLVGTTQGNYYLIRLGTFLDDGQSPNEAPALTPGSMTVSYRSTLYDNGRQKRVKKVSDGSLINLYYTSGYQSATNSSYLIAQPFTLASGGTIDGFEFVGFNYSTANSLPAGAALADTLRYAVYSRSGNWLNAFSEANGETLVAEGTVTFNPNSYANINTDYGRRYFIDLATPIDLFSGDYYWVLKPEKAGATNGAFGIFYYAADGIPQQSPTSFRPAYWASLNWPTTGFGRYAASATPTYVVQTGDNPDIYYKTALRLKGVVNACFGDIDGSGEVDNGDVAFALLDYGPCSGCASDLDGTGEVDFGDVALILLSTGPCQ
jgi:hypothetical protein